MLEKLTKIKGQICSVVDYDDNYLLGDCLEELAFLHKPVTIYFRNEDSLIEDTDMMKSLVKVDSHVVYVCEVEYKVLVIVERNVFDTFTDDLCRVINDIEFDINILSQYLSVADINDIVYKLNLISDKLSLIYKEKVGV